MFIKHMFSTRVKILTFIGKLIVIYFIKSKFYVASEFFLLNENCSGGHLIIIRFHFDDVPSMFISKLTLTY